MRTAQPHRTTPAATHLLRAHVQVQRANEMHKLVIIQKAILVVIVLGKLPIQPRHDLVEFPYALGEALRLGGLVGVQGMSVFAAAVDDNVGATDEVSGDAALHACLGGQGEGGNELKKGKESDRTGQWRGEKRRCVPG